jgi:hypothetical protein
MTTKRAPRAVSKDDEKEYHKSHPAPCWDCKEDVHRKVLELQCQFQDYNILTSLPYILFYCERERKVRELEGDPIDGRLSIPPAGAKA